MEPLKEFSRTLLSLENCIIPKERLLHTPSSKDGMSRETEIDVRIKGCECIQSAGFMLKLPQAAMATAQINFHRFFYAKSLVKFNFYYSAVASLFLATKIEECNRRLRDVLNVFHHLKQKRKGSPSQGMAVGVATDLNHCKITPMDYVGEEYYRMRNTINKYERYILKELGFCVHVQHPHKLVITCLQLLGLERNVGLAQKAWNFMNDGLRTNIFVRYEVPTIACACIFLAARQIKIPLPEKKPGWWSLFDVRFKDMKAISLELLALYNRPVRTLDELEKEVDTIKELLTSQKKVEVKEIHIKKKDLLNASSPATQQSVSPISTQSPNLSSQETTKSSQSPVNGYKRERSDADTPTIIEKKPKLAESRLQRQTPEAYKPILSPIKLSSDSQSDKSLSPLSSPPTRINGHVYKNDVTSDSTSSLRKHRHKHRSSKHHRHHRERSRERERTSSEKHHRHRHKEDRSRRTVTISRDYDRSRKSADSYYR